MSGCCFRATRLKSLNIVILLVCYHPRLSFVALPLFLCQSQPPVSTASLLFPLPFNQSLPQSWIATVLSTFNYDHTVQGFESLSCRAGRFLITKLISKWAQKMTSTSSSRFMLHHEDISQGKNKTGSSNHPSILLCLRWNISNTLQKLYKQCGSQIQLYLYERSIKYKRLKYGSRKCIYFRGGRKTRKEGEKGKKIQFGPCHRFYIRWLFSIFEHSRNAKPQHKQNIGLKKSTIYI